MRKNLSAAGNLAPRPVVGYNADMARASLQSVPPILSAAAGLPGAGAAGGADGAGWRVIQGDCRTILPLLPEKSVNMIFADPPYNLQLKGELWRPNMTRVDGVEDDWDKFASFAEYDQFCEAWLRECRRVLADDGTIWVIGSYHNIGRVARLMQDLGFWTLNDVIWRKTNPMPNFRGVRFTNATETLLWAKKSAKGRYFFNHALMKRENGGKQMTNVWEFPLCGGAERLRDGDGKKLHSTQKPEALLRRAILCATRPGDVVLDPFLGSGTTAAAARRAGRIGVGIEREEKYVRVAAARIAAAQPDDMTLMLEAEATPEKPPRVAFRELVDAGAIVVGERLYAKKGEVVAEVLADGELRINGFAGSIHRAGAKVAGVPSCNGWNFWSVKKESGEFVLIDDLRAEYRRLPAQGGMS